MCEKLNKSDKLDKSDKSDMSDMLDMNNTCDDRLQMTMVPLPVIKELHRKQSFDEWYNEHRSILMVMFETSHNQMLDVMDIPNMKLCGRDGVRCHGYEQNELYYNFVHFLYTRS